MTGVAKAAATSPADVELASKGDEAAFARLVDRHHAEMARIAYAITADRSLAEDAVQSAWTIAWRKLGSIREPAKAREWLLAVVVNEARQVVRRRQRVTIVEIDPEAGPSIDPGGQGDPHAAITRIDLARALGSLTPEDRALIALRYVADLDAATIGGLTGRSASATRTRLSRLTARLREQLQR